MVRITSFLRDSLRSFPFLFFLGEQIRLSPIGVAQMEG